MRLIPTTLLFERVNLLLQAFQFLRNNDDFLRGDGRLTNFLDLHILSLVQSNWQSITYSRFDDNAKNTLGAKFISTHGETTITLDTNFIDTRFKITQTKHTTH